MKRTLFTIALIATCTAALATYPTPTPPASTPVDIDATLKQQQKAQADADAAAKAKAAADAKAKAAADADAESYGGGAAINDNSRTSMFVLPPPVWTQVPQAAGCIVTSSRAGSLLLGVVSGSKTDQKSDPVCVGVLMAKAAYDHCHFESEALITQRIYETIFPGHPELPIAPGTRNHSLAECEGLKRPRLVLAPSIATPPVITPTPVTAPVTAPVACVAPEPQKPAVRRIVKAKPKAPGCAI
ncbi:hypothetical protein [Hydrogenophaga sp. ANAO-22]|uniref:hypothetical protein n=1 Tax=Hydrogenophaga sp. ANAO-22 TaxID=3166645 RepID=UPI0036D31D37